MKQMPIGRGFAGPVLAGLILTDAASAASDALKYYPTSVAPTLPTPSAVSAMRGDAPRGILAVLQSAYRRSVGQGWSGRQSHRRLGLALSGHHPERQSAPLDQRCGFRKTLTSDTEAQAEVG